MSLANGNYENKDVNEIKDDLNEEFDANQENRTRDDLDLYNSWLSIAEKYQDDMLHMKDEACGLWDKYEDQWNSLEVTLKANIDRLNSAGYAFFTENDQIVDKIANHINEVEDSVLQLLEDHSKSIQEQEKVEAAVEAAGTDFFEPNEDGSFTLTAATNEPTIHDVLWDMIQPNETWLIDYTTVNNDTRNIKERMTGANAIWATTCYLTYGEWDDGAMTYILQGLDGKKINTRARVRDGVKLTPPWVLKAQGRIQKNIEKHETKEALKQKSQSGETLDDMRQSPHWKSVMAAIPPGLRWRLEAAAAVDESVFIDFLKKSESKLDELVLYAKQKDMLLSSVPLSKSTLSRGGMMEVHLIDAGKEVTLPFLDEQDDNLGALYDVIDDGAFVWEGDYQTFLTSRINAKWDDYAAQDKYENVLADVEWTEMLDKQQVIDAQYGLGLFDQLVDSLRQSKWDTYLYQDHFLASLKQYTQDALYSLEAWDVSKEGIQEIKDTLAKKYMIIRSNEFVSSSNSSWKISWFINDVFSGEADPKTLIAIRELWADLDVWNHAWFVIDEESIHEDLIINETWYDEMYQNISKKLDASIEGNNKLLHRLYTAANISDQQTGRDMVLSILQEQNILPTHVRTTDLDRLGKYSSTDQEYIAKEIWKKMKETKKTYEEHSEVSKETIWKWMIAEKNSLLASENLSEADISRLQVINFLEQDEASRESILSLQLGQSTWENMVIASIEGTVKWLATPLLVNHGGWSNSDIVNDIVWYWLLDISDKNAGMIRAMLPMIVTEIALMVAASALIASWVGSAAWVALIGTRITAMWAKIWMKAPMIKRMITGVQMTMKAATKNQKVTGAVAKVKSRASKIATPLKNAGTRIKAKIPNRSRKPTPTTKAPSTVKPSSSKSITKQSLDLWWTHTILHNTLTGELDKDYKQWAVDFFQRAWMYGIMNKIWASLQAWRLTRYLPVDESTKAAKLVSTGKRNVAAYFLEEGLMNPMDLVINMTFADKNLTPEEIWVNLAMWFLFQFVPWVSSIVMWKAHMTINGKKMSIEAASKVLEKNMPAIKNAMWDLSARESGALWSDAPVSKMKKRRDQINKRAETETDPDIKATLDDAVRVLEERIGKAEIKWKTPKTEAEQRTDSPSGNSPEATISSSQKDKIVDDFIDNRSGTLLKKDIEYYSEKEMRDLAESYMWRSKSELNSKRSKFAGEYDQVKGKSSAARRERDILRSKIMLIDDLISIKQGAWGESKAKWLEQKQPKASKKKKLEANKKKLEAKKATREEQQWVFAWQLLVWVDKVKTGIPKTLRKHLPDSVKKFSDGRTIPTKQQIINLQKDIWTPKDQIDWLFTNETLNQLNWFLDDFKKDGIKKEVVSLIEKKKKIENKTVDNTLVLKNFDETLWAIKKDEKKARANQRKINKLYAEKKLASDELWVLFNKLGESKLALENPPKRPKRSEKKAIEKQIDALEAQILDKDRAFAPRKEKINAEMIRLQKQNNKIKAKYGIDSITDFAKKVSSMGEGRTEIAGLVEKQWKAMKKLDSQIKKLEEGKIVAKQKSEEPSIDLENITRLTDAQEQKIVDDLMNDPYYREDIGVSNADKQRFVYESLLLTDNQLAKKIDTIDAEFSALKDGDLGSRLKREELLTQRKALVDIQVARADKIAVKKTVVVSKSTPNKALKKTSTPSKSEDQMISEFVENYRRTATETDRGLITNVELENMAKSTLWLSKLELNTKRADIVTKYDTLTWASSGDRRQRDLWLAHLFLIDDLIAKKTINDSLSEARSTGNSKKIDEIAANSKEIKKKTKNLSRKKTLESKTNKDELPSMIKDVMKNANLEKIQTKDQARKKVHEILDAIHENRWHLSPSHAKKLLERLDGLKKLLTDRVWYFMKWWLSKKFSSLKKVLKKTSEKSEVHLDAEKSLIWEISSSLELFKKELPAIQWWVTPNKYVTFAKQIDTAHDWFIAQVKSFEKQYWNSTEIKSLMDEYKAIVKDIHSLRRKKNKVIKN